MEFVIKFIKFCYISLADIRKKLILFRKLDPVGLQEVEHGVQQLMKGEFTPTLQIQGPKFLLLHH